MKREDIKNVIEQVIRDVFENMYFMFPEVVGEDDPAPSLLETCFKARVRAKNGLEVFLFYASERLVTGMAKNLLGTNQATKESDLVDVFKEAANVMAGNLVTALALGGSVGLDIPAAEKLKICPEVETAPGTAFNIDGEYFKLAVMNSKGNKM